MEFSDLLSLNHRVALTPSVTQFRAKDGSFLVKHDNKLFKISGKSNGNWETRLLRFLRRPKNLKEILSLLSDYKRKDVINVLEKLYNLNLISFATPADKNQSNDIKARNNILYNNQVIEEVGSHTICIIGNGVLADMLIKHLNEMKIKITRIKSLKTDLIYSKKNGNKGRRGKPNSDAYSKSSSLSYLLNTIFDKCSLIVVAEDYPNLALFEVVNSESFRRKIPWIRVSFDDSKGYVGPLVIPRKTPCFNCCQLRLIANSPYYEYELWENREFIPRTKLKKPNIFADILSIICTDEILRFMINSSLPGTIGYLFEFDVHNLNFSKHKIISHPNCILCNPPVKKPIDLQHPLVDPSLSIRISSLGDYHKPNFLSESELIDTLRELIDERTGPILEYERLYENSRLGIYFHYFATATCSKPLRIGIDGKFKRPIRAEDSLITPSPTGSGFSANEAEIRALMESVERYSNMVLDESRLIWSSYEDLQEYAINPTDLGLYTDEQYTRQDLPCSRFSIHSEIPWIRGHDMSSGKIILVPADFVYYPAIRDKPLVFDTSNGASAHVDLVQAILNGLFELIERDSFLTMWLNRISMPLLDIRSIPSGFAESMSKINEFGMNVKLVNLTNDILVTTIMAVCHNKRADRYPALVVGTGTHIDPQKALQKALFEMEFALIEAMENPDKKEVEHPDKISEIFENFRYYLNPKRRNIGNL
jgi:ribosomal protein S12 methylthiotransferase accessory factor